MAPVLSMIACFSSGIDKGSFSNDPLNTLGSSSQENMRTTGDKSGEFKSRKCGDNLRSRHQLTSLWVNP